MVENTKTISNPMESEKLSKLIFKFSLPCVVAMVVNALYNIIDQIFIGQGVGYIGNAATTVAFPLFVLSEGLALLFGDGAAAFYSIKLGENNPKEGIKAVGNSITMLIIIGILFGIVSYIFIEELLWSFGATENNIAYALDYMKIVLISMPLAIISTGLSSIIRADGNPQYAMFSLLIGTIINCVLDPILIFGFNMGVIGAAITTVIGQIISFIISINYFNRFKTIKFKKEDFIINKKVIKTIMLFGLSTFITQVAVTFIVIVSNNMISKYGAESMYGSDIPLSAIGIVMKVNDILLGIVIGIAVGGQPIVGYNYGAKNIKRVKEAYYIIIKIATAVSMIAFIIFQFFPQQLVYLFGKNDALYNEFAIKAFRIFLMLCLFTGFELTTMIFFQAIGKPQKSVILTLCKQTIFIIPLMLVFPRFFGVEGVLYAGPCAEFMSVGVTLIMIITQFKDFNKKLILP